MGYGNPGRAIEVPTATTGIDSVTTKSIRVADKARDLVGRLHEIAGRVLAPGDQKSIDGPVPSTPAHAMFALESAEQSLDEAHQVVSVLLQAI